MTSIRINNNWNYQKILITEATISLGGVTLPGVTVLGVSSCQNASDISLGRACATGAEPLFLKFFCIILGKINKFGKSWWAFSFINNNLSSLTISQIEQNLWFYFIYKALEQSVTGSIVKFLKNGVVTILRTI